MDCTPDRALIYSLIQGGVPAFQHAKSVGITASTIVDADDRIIFSACEEVFLPKGRMPSISDIRQHYNIALATPDVMFDYELCAKDIMTRTLMTRLNQGLGPIEDLIPIDPYAAREALGELVKSTNWTMGRVARTNSPSSINEVRRRYLEAKSRDGGLLGFSSPWPSRDKASLGLQEGEVTVLLAKRKTGKCVSADTLITCPTTGRQVTVEEFVLSGDGLVYTWDKGLPVESVRPDAYVDTGTKECLKITWRSGRTLVATPEHPLMTPTGWKRLDELQEGRHTAAVAKLPEPLKTQAFYDEECMFLAFMIAEGGCSKPSTPTFTSSVPEIVDEMKHCLLHMGCSLKPVVGRPGNYYVVGDRRASIRENISGTTKVLRFLRSMNMLEKKSIEKEIPDQVFATDDHQLAVFLGRLWSCDGTVEARGVVSYSTGSRKLADQVQHLLLRFGVTSRIRTLPHKIKGGTEERDYFEVVVRKERIENFKRTVGREMIGPKAKKIQKVKFHGRSRVGWIRNEELWDQIREEMETRPELVSAVGEELGYEFRFQKSHVLDYKSGRVRKKVFEAFCDVYDSDLKWVLDDNITWDEIVVVEPVGVKRVFDLTVIPTHCFIANDVIVHNTWILLAWLEHIWTSIKEGKPELGPGECILVVSMEMPVWQVMRRLFAIHKKLDYEKFRSGSLSDEEEERFLSWCDEMEKPDPQRSEVIIVSSDKCRTVDDIVGLVAQYRPKVVFIDSFYILDAPGRMQMWERMIHNIKAIKLDIAAQFLIPVVTTTQLSGQVKRGDLNAEADAVAYAKAVGDYADSIDGLFGNDKFRDSGRRILRGMEAREFKTVDLEIEFDPGTHKYGEIRVLDRIEDGDNQSLGSADNSDEGPDDGPSSGGGDSWNDEDTILID